MPTVSFCVPVYNRADRIRQCIESMIKQTAAKDDYEVIVVDDCSTDGTAEVVQGIFDEHGFMNGRVETLPANSGGASAPRNAAVAMARGDYLFFVDSDDYVVPETVEKIRWCATEFNSDIIYPQYHRETQAGEITSKPHAFARKGDIGRADILRDHMINAMSVLKAFKRSEWERLNIEFDPDLRTGEDVLVTAKFLFNTAIRSVIADRTYYVIVDHESDRLTQKPTARAGTFRNYGVILDVIYSGTVGDQKYKHRSAAAFINRIMRQGAGANNAFLAPSVSAKSQNEWKKQWTSLLSEHLPVEADEYLDPAFKRKIQFLRAGDLVGAGFAVAYHEIEGSGQDLYEGLLLHVRSVASATPPAATTRERKMAAELKSALARERSLQTEVRAMHASTSWRVTSPLRTLTRFVKGCASFVRGDRRAWREAIDGRAGSQGGPSLVALRLDEDGRPEAVLGNLAPGQQMAVFAEVNPAGYRDARHRLPLRDAGDRTIAARLPVPATVGDCLVRLSIESGEDRREVSAARGRHRVTTPELSATVTARGVRVERTAPAPAWRAVKHEETER